MKITLSAPAKINLTLAITGIREDGYHLLESVMQTVSLSDTVTVEKIPAGIVISCTRAGIPLDEKNLCYKAAKTYLDRAELAGGVKITLQKAIPDGAGLGGGSSDAAAVLKAMRALFPGNVDLTAIAEKIGADVPFFLEGGSCLCRGIGEKLFPLAFPAKKDLCCVIAKPKEGLSTPRVYQCYDVGATNFSPPLSQEALLAFQKGEAKEIFSHLQNDLELPAIALLPEIGALKDLFFSLGAKGAMMTGSGSAVFGLFQEERDARRCAEKIRESGTDAYFCTLL